MRCYCCNRALSDYESTLKSVNTGDFLDTCLQCLQDLDIQFVGNNKNSNEVNEDFELFDDEIDEELSDVEEE